MSSFFVGPPDKQIFSTLSEPRQQLNCNKLVVLCYPFGQEYMRAHRCYRQLANLLARSGLTTLRFDYPSAGDSYGDSPLENVSDLIVDIDRVVQFVQERTQIREVYVVGLRFGALIAAKVAEHMAAVTSLFLWDAYACGSDFVADCKNQLSENKDSSQALGSNDTWLVHGFPLAPAFRAAIEAVDIRECRFDGAMKIFHTLSHENSSSLALQQCFGQRMAQQVVPSNGDWNYIDMQGSILMPTVLINALSKTIATA